MGCGGSKADAVSPTISPRKSIVLQPPVAININVGENVQGFPATPQPRAFVIVGGPGSGKGRVVANLCSMYGMVLVSAEDLVLKFLPKKVAHTLELKTTKDIMDLLRKEPERVQLDWVLRLVQHQVEQQPGKTYIIDILPNLKWLQRNECLIANCEEHLKVFEEKVKIPFALNLSLTQDSLENTLDYSHHNTSNMKPAGATVGDEADNSRAKRRFSMHQKAAAPFVDYFSKQKRLVSVDVSSGLEEAIWDKIHEFFTTIDLHAWRPVYSVMVFAMSGMKVGNLDFTETEMPVITLKDIADDPAGTLDGLLESLCCYIDNEMADKNHHFVIDPLGTTIMSYVNSTQELSKNAIVFSDRRHDQSTCINKFSVHLNKLCGGDPQFKAVCSSEDETLLFPVTVNDAFCKHIALLMSEKHPSKRA